MNRIETFLTVYGLSAIAAILLIKSIGVPIPIPADVLMFAAVARVANGTDGLARGPGRSMVYRLNPAANVRRHAQVDA